MRAGTVAPVVVQVEVAAQDDWIGTGEHSVAIAVGFGGDRCFAVADAGVVVGEWPKQRVAAELDSVAVDSSSAVAAAAGAGVVGVAAADPSSAAAAVAVVPKQAAAGAVVAVEVVAIVGCGVGLGSCNHRSARSSPVQVAVQLCSDTETVAMGLAAKVLV